MPYFSGLLHPSVLIHPEHNNTYPNACHRIARDSIFRVTNKFHPLFGKEFTVLSNHFIQGVDSIFFRIERNSITSIPVRWTSLKPQNPYVVISNGRSLFCPKDLLDLAQLVKYLKSEQKHRRKGKAKK